MSAHHSQFNRLAQRQNARAALDRLGSGAGRLSKSGGGFDGRRFSIEHAADLSAVREVAPEAATRIMAAVPDPGLGESNPTALSRAIALAKSVVSGLLAEDVATNLIGRGRDATNDRAAAMAAEAKFRGSGWRKP